MTSEGAEAAADVPDGTMAAKTIEPEARDARPECEAARAVCLNCGEVLTGEYCASCGQSAHIHRSFRSLGHDLLHFVFHFEGKFWRTIPELVFRPGRLTRRYIEGERTKFISPLALFLFTVFVMYGIFAFLPDVVAVNRAPPSEAAAPESAQDEGTNPFRAALQKLEEDPDLVFYKMKSNGYKWSWLLVPLSIPFMWALFFWRREYTLYDHAIFVTYSISFMMILLIVSTLAQVAGAGGGIQAALLMLVPPLHLYKQLRVTYRLSRPATFVRLFVVLIAAAAVLSAFVTMLLLIGALE